jgi:hypothetical protein
MRAAFPAVTTDKALTMDAAQLQNAMLLADAAGTVREAAAKLREQFAPLRVVVVDAMDMRDETPAATGAKRALYLGETDGHCWTMTQDLAKTAGLFIADKG